MEKITNAIIDTREMKIYMYTRISSSVHRDIIHNDLKVETMQISFHGNIHLWMGFRYNIIHGHNKKKCYFLKTLSNM